MLHELSLRFIERHPEDASRTLERYSDGDKVLLLASIHPAPAARLLRSMIPADAGRILTQLETGKAVALLAELPANIAAACMRRMTGDGRARILEQAESANTLKNAQRLLRFPPHTAGAIMDPEALVLQADMNFAEAIEALRRSGVTLPNLIYRVDSSHTLQGYIRTSDLLLFPGVTPLANIMQPCPHTLAAHAGLESVQASPGWTQADDLPVVDSSGALLGVLTRMKLEHALADLDRHAGGGETKDILLGLTETFIDACTELLYPGKNTEPDSLTAPRKTPE